MTTTEHSRARDEHLWPGAGTIHWADVSRCIAALKTPPAGMLEIAGDPGGDPLDGITQQCTSAWKLLETPPSA